MADWRRSGAHPDKTTLAFKLQRAISAPGHIAPYIGRYIQYLRLSRRAGSQEELFRLYVDDLAKQNADKAVGPSDSKSDWDAIGNLQFNRLLEEGLKPHHRILDIGCGNLRGGWRMIQYLDEGNYVGADISREILIAALDTIRSHGLSEKRPYLYAIKGMELNFLPAGFDFANAHSVFSHCEMPAIVKCLTEVRGLLKPHGTFALTFLESQGAPFNILRQDFYYPRTDLIGAAERAGFDVSVCEGWGHIQTRLLCRVGGH